MGVEDGTYQILRGRLAERAGELGRRAAELNVRRQEVFGSRPLELTGAVRPRTQGAATACGVVVVRTDVLLLGTSAPSLAEGLLSLHGPDGTPLPEAAVPGLLDDERFHRDLAELLRYFRGSRLVDLVRSPAGRLLAVFRTGENDGDIRVLRWQVTETGAAYLDNHGERDLPLPPAFELPWRTAGRDHHDQGRIRIEGAAGTVSVANTGGALTVRALPGGRPLFEEPVDDPLQSLADAAVAYAETGPLLLLRVRPYNEPVDRFLVVNLRTGTVRRHDSLGRGARLLPAEQGLIFPGGYELAAGGHRTFHLDEVGPDHTAGAAAPAAGPASSTAPYPTGPADELRFDAVLASPNGEDLLYVLRRPGRAQALLLPWNTVRREAGAALHGAGYAVLPDGTLTLLKPDREPVRTHELQLWRTPFLSAEYAAAQPVGDGPLARIGNADLVRGIADCLDLVRTAKAAGAASTAHTTNTASGEAGSAARAFPDGGPHGSSARSDASAARPPGSSGPSAGRQDATPDPAATSLGNPAADPAAGPNLTAALPTLILDGCAKLGDRHYWLDEAGLLEPLTELRAAAEQLAAEQARMDLLAARAAEALSRTAAEAAALIRRSHGEPPTDADTWTALLADLRRAQGRTRLLRELPRLDLAALDSVEAGLSAELAAATERAFAYFAGPDAFAAPLAAARSAADAAAETATAAEAARLADRLAGQADSLALVTDLVTGAVTADPSAGTAVLLAIGEVLAAANRARAVLETRRRALLDSEHRAAHAAESALLAQATTAALAAADSPAGCDDQLAGLLLRFDGLEARFAEAEDLAADLAVRREEVRQAFAVRRQALLDESAARADRLAAAALRALEALRRRLSGLGSAEDVNAALATDPMALRVRSAAAELRTLDDQVRAQELTDSLAGAGRTALRVLRDRADLSSDGGATVRFGRHRFAVRREPVELTLQPDGDELVFSITGTAYRRAARVPELLAGREFWHQPLISESPALYRAEYLAGGLLATATGEPPLVQVRRLAERAYDEGYERGVHDHDAALILDALLRLRAGAGLLAHPAEVRAAAQLFWAYGAGEGRRAAWQRRAGSLTLARGAFAPAAGPAAEPTDQPTPAPSTPEPSAPGPLTALTALAAELSAAVAEFTHANGLPATPPAGAYLVEELAHPDEGFATSAASRSLLDAFRRTSAAARLAADLAALADDLPARHQLATAWLGSYAASVGADEGLPEAVSQLCAPALPRYDIAAPLSETVEGLLGTHPRVRAGRLTVRVDRLPQRARDFREKRAPAFRAFQRRRTDVLTAERARLRLDSYRPRPLAGFVRNQLIDEVYLPVIGDNLAKQLGTPGGTADRSGLLLLLSPPGYGKTTLLEYVADRLGLLMVRVDGPALGAGTTSLDPDRAPDAAARAEVEKIVFALEAGSNVLLHLDDIQHVSAGLLEKFIPLCDAQRRIEAVSDGRPRSFDLRGRRFAVCLAGNPYAASGRRFQVPDMLANRADLWNLGEVTAARQDLFALSFLENALAANPVLAPLAGCDPAELRLLVALADGDPAARADQLARPVGDLARIVATLAALRTIQRTVLAVNRCYVASAGQEEADRVEPPFLLQGSYRTMAQLAARVDPVLDDAELQALLDEHYFAEAQALGSAAEASLLKLAHLRGRATPEQAARWRGLCAAYSGGLTPHTAGSSAWR
ncbi:DNA repair ATPase [Streptomyces sp. NBC_01190]|uniref:DNA repair ATPase n=1 Tax=Streptomyces sp. NBC_01190 TaxID=2903767 RepID=UPI003867987B|nr:DNA repair ATPase [Streptomyces sp. NBC_01190]